MTDRPTISENERALLQDLTRSPGWRVLSDNLWAWQRAVNTAFCENTDKDHRYWQGFSAGFRHAEALALKWSEAEKKPAETIQPDETALQAHPRREWS